MPTADSLYRKIGGLELPVEALDVTDTLAPLDPARDTALDFFTSAINTEFSAAWTKVTNAADFLSGTSPVQTKLPFRPSAQLFNEQKIAFPCLALYRDGRGETEQHTLVEERVRQRWALDYILAPMDSADERRLGDILIGVVKTLLLTIREGRHPGYSDGTTRVFDTDTFSTIEIVSYQFGQANFAGSDEAPTYLAASLQLETTENFGFVDGAETDITGVTFELGTGNADGIIPNLIYAHTETPLG